MFVNSTRHTTTTNDFISRAEPSAMVTAPRHKKYGFHQTFAGPLEDLLDCSKLTLPKKM